MGGGKWVQPSQQASQLTAQNTVTFLSLGLGAQALATQAHDDLGCEKKPKTLLLFQILKVASAFLFHIHLKFWTKFSCLRNSKKRCRHLGRVILLSEVFSTLKH